MRKRKFTIVNATCSIIPIWAHITKIGFSWKIAKLNFRDAPKHENLIRNRLRRSWRRSNEHQSKFKFSATYLETKHCTSPTAKLLLANTNPSFGNLLVHCGICANSKAQKLQQVAFKARRTPTTTNINPRLVQTFLQLLSEVRGRHLREKSVEQRIFLMFKC